MTPFSSHVMVDRQFWVYDPLLDSCHDSQAVWVCDHLDSSIFRQAVFNLTPPPLLIRKAVLVWNCHSVSSQDLRLQKLVRLLQSRLNFRINFRNSIKKSEVDQCSCWAHVSYVGGGGWFTPSLKICLISWISLIFWLTNYVRPTTNMIFLTSCSNAKIW